VTKQGESYSPTILTTLELAIVNCEKQKPQLQYFTKSSVKQGAVFL